MKHLSLDIYLFSGLRERSCVGDAFCHIWSWRGRYSHVSGC